MLRCWVCAICALGSVPRSDHHPASARAACLDRAAGLGARRRPVRNGDGVHFHRRAPGHLRASRSRSKWSTGGSCCKAAATRASPASSTTRSSADTATSAAPSRCPRRSRPTHRRRLVERRAHDHRSQGSRARAAPRFGVMITRLSVVGLLFSAGLIAGLVLSGRARQSRRHRQPAAVGRRRRRTTSDRRAPSPPGDRRARFHARRRTDRQGRHQHFVGAGRAAQRLAVRQRSVLPVFLRRSRARCSAAAAPNRAWIRRRDLARRPGRHQQPRARRRCRPR